MKTKEPRWRKQYVIVSVNQRELKPNEGKCTYCQGKRYCEKYGCPCSTDQQMKLKINIIDNPIQLDDINPISIN